MCEHALPYFPDSVAIYTWLVKMYSKLGLTSLVTNLSHSFPLNENDTLGFERLGSTRFSLYTDYGMHGDLEELIEEYQAFYKDKVNENTESIIQLYKNCDFNNIRPLMIKNEKLNVSGF